MEIIKFIEESSYYTPIEWATQDKIASGEAIAYMRGQGAGRQQAIELIKKYLDDRCDHVYGDSFGTCLKCRF